jgi:hypothetical protein
MGVVMPAGDESARQTEAFRRLLVMAMLSEICTGLILAA